MKERPIIFSAPMVRRTLADDKTQTRRVVKPQPADALHLTHSGFSAWHNEKGKPLRNPYGQPGDRLWVREAFSVCTDGETVSYKATDSNLSAYGWKPSIHMPRWASRITLEITGVRVERLQDISADDCIAEGIEPAHTGDAAEESALARSAYASLWESINGAGSWAANPWVWVIEFGRVNA